MTGGFVADASVAVAWAVPSRASMRTDSLLDAVASGTPLIVPSIWPFEVANALLVLVRRKKIMPADRDQALVFFRRLAPDVDNEGVAHALTTIAGLAAEAGLSVYDAAYLELAMRRALPLASIDGPLTKAARRRSVAVLDFK